MTLYYSLIAMVLGLGWFFASPGLFALVLFGGGLTVGALAFLGDVFDILRGR